MALAAIAAGAKPANRMMTVMSRRKRKLLRIVIHSFQSVARSTVSTLGGEARCSKRMNTTATIAVIMMNPTPHTPDTSASSNLGLSSPICGFAFAFAVGSATGAAATRAGCVSAGVAAMPVAAGGLGCAAGAAAAADAVVPVAGCSADAPISVGCAAGAFTTAVASADCAAGACVGAGWVVGAAAVALV